MFASAIALIVILIALMSRLSVKPIHYTGGAQEVVYRSSATRTSSNLTPVYTSYAESVLLGADWSEYDFNLWGTCLDEQYPGAFNKLNVITYIHHMRHSADSVPFKVDAVNVLEYLRSSDYTLRTHEQVMTAAAALPEIAVRGNLLCNLVLQDINNTECKKVIEMIKAHNIEVIRAEDVDGQEMGDKPFIVLGSMYTTGYKLIMACSHISLQLPVLTLLSDFSSAKTTTAQYLQYLTHKERLLGGHVNVNPQSFEVHLTQVLIPQAELKKRYTDVTHVIGHAGSGKTTLSQQVDGSVDLDVIFDAHHTHEARYEALAKCLEEGARVFVGTPIDLSVLAATRYYLDVPEDIVYRRLTLRTLNSLCDSDMRAEIAKSTDLERDFNELSRKYGIRMAGWAAPEVIYDFMRRQKLGWLLSRYVPLGPDEILAKLRF